MLVCLLASLLSFPCFLLIREYIHSFPPQIPIAARVSGPLLPFPADHITESLYHPYVAHGITSSSSLHQRGPSLPPNRPFGSAMICVNPKFSCFFSKSSNSSRSKISVLVRVGVDEVDLNLVVVVVVDVLLLAVEHVFDGLSDRRHSRAAPRRD